jgi:hypothetical protein
MNNMSKFVLLVAAASALTACATFYDPMRGYDSGPWCGIEDSATRESDSRVVLFYVEKVDGQPIDQAWAATSRYNEGRGFAVDPKPVIRNLPARPMRLTLVAQTYNGAPVLDLFRKNFVVRGEIDFVPQDQTFYVVKGVLNADYGAVWLADQRTGARVGPAVESGTANK